MPLWVYDLVAAGCPVVTVAACMEHLGAAPELSEGFVTVAADAGLLAGAIESLLVDRIRMAYSLTAAPSVSASCPMRLKPPGCCLALSSQPGPLP